MREFLRNVGSGLFDFGLNLRDLGYFVVRLTSGVSFAAAAAHRRNQNWTWGWELPEAALLAASWVTGLVTWNILLSYLSNCGCAPQTALLLATAITVTAYNCERNN